MCKKASLLVSDSQTIFFQLQLPTKLFRRIVSRTNSLTK
jgi:hypothetical protein